MTTLAADDPKPVKLRQEKSPGIWAMALRRLMRNRAAILGLAIIILMVYCAIFADSLARKPYAKQSLADNNAVASWIPYVFTSLKPKSQGGYAKINDSYPLGADALGRDMLSRLLYGTRISLAVAFIGPMISLLVGVFVGSLAGLYGGWLDNVLMRFVDLMYAFPSLLLIILMMAFFRSSLNGSNGTGLALQLGKLDAAFGGLLFIFIGIGLTSWENMARLTRAQVISTREREYVLAAQSIGMTRRQIMVQQILPNILGPLIVAETLAIPSYISTEAFLSYIGLGVNKPTPSWGAMISDGVATINTYPNQVILPAIVLALAMFAFNFLGDGLRDALDPRSQNMR